MTQNYPSLETAATTPTRSVCRFGFVQVPLFLPILIASHRIRKWNGGHLCPRLKFGFRLYERKDLNLPPRLIEKLRYRFTHGSTPYRPRLPEHPKRKPAHKRNQHDDQAGQQPR